MSEVSNAEDLLIDALQDLRAAEVALGERLPDIAAWADDDALNEAFAEYSRHAKAQAPSLAAAIKGLKSNPEGAPNIWMNAVLDDAERDTRMVKGGRWLDIALVGALRKGAQAARVSYETAVVLAEAVSDDEVKQLTSNLRDAHAAFDARLAELLGPLAGTAQGGGR